MSVSVSVCVCPCGFARHGRHIWFSLSLTDWRSKSSLLPGEKVWVSPYILQAQHVVSVTCPLLESVGAVWGLGNAGAPALAEERGH